MAKKRTSKTDDLGTNRAWSASPPAKDQELHEQEADEEPPDEPYWEVEKWDRGEAKLLGMELAEFRKLRELARKVPGPDKYNPKDKIWNYLIAEYGFGPETLWRMTPNDMERYVEARQSVAKAPESYRLSTPPAEEWLPASEAVKRAQKAGLNVTLPSLIRYAKKWGVKIRPRTLPGNHRREVEFQSLVVYLVRQASGERLSGEDDEELSEGEFEGRIEKARLARQRHRPD
jgi:hypothetical protein